MLVNAQGISVREAEWWLDVDACLHKQQLWTHSILHHEYLLQQMFQHTTVTGQREYEHAICQG